MTNTMLAQALRYHDAGFSVFPLLPNSKRPHANLLKQTGYVSETDPSTGSWKPLQTTLPTRDDIIYWFTEEPEANLATATGQLSNLTVIDIDTPKPDSPHPHLSTDEILQLFLSHFTNIPHQRTGRGGYHLFFAYNPTIPCSTGVIHPQVDTKSEGGYIILDPSIHPETKEQYTFLAKSPWPPQPIAQDDLKVIFPESKRTKKKTTSITKTLTQGAPNGRRNTAAAEVAGFLIKYAAQYTDLSSILQLFRAWNTLNRPPLDSEELDAVFNSIYEKDYVSGGKA